MRSLLRFVLLAAAYAPLCSCIIWLPDTGHLARGDLGSRWTDLEIGQTVRSDVLLSLGEPEWSDATERKWLYWVIEAHSFFCLYMIAGMVTQESSTDHFYLLEFDERGVLVKQREVTAPHTYGSPGYDAISESDLRALFELPADVTEIEDVPRNSPWVKQ